MRLVLFVGLAAVLVACAAVAFVRSESVVSEEPLLPEKNPIAAILEIGKMEGDAARAQAMAEEVRERYANMKTLALTAVETAYWYDTDEATKALDDVAQRELCCIKMSQTWDTFDTNVTVKREVVLEHSLSGGTLTEYNRRSQKGISYPIDGHIPRLQQDVPHEVLCLVGMFRRPWIGPPERFHAHHLSLDPASINAAQVWARMIEQGAWMGRRPNPFASKDGSTVEHDLVVWKRGNLWDVLYVDDGLVLTFVTLEFEGDPGESRDVFIKAVVFGHALDLNGVLAGADSMRDFRAVEKGGELATR